MSDEELRSRLHDGVGAPPPGALDRVMDGARARALGGGRRGFAPALAVAVALLVVVLGGAGLWAALRSARGPAPVAVAGPTPSAAASPSEAASATPEVSPVPSPSPSEGPLVVLPTTAEISASGGATWVRIAGMSGDLLYNSTDGGSTWSRRSLPDTGAPAVSGWSFADARNGLALGAGTPTTQCQSMTTKVWRTSDGALTWQNAAERGLADTQCKGYLSVVDAGAAFLSAWDPNSRPVIYRSADAGSSWTASTPLPDPPGQVTRTGGNSLTPHSVWRAGSQLLVAASGWQHLYVYASTDGGATWSARVTVPGATDVDALAFMDASHWWLSGPGFGPNYQYTADAGAHFGRAPGGPGSAAPIAPVFSFADLHTGYATVRGSIWRTADGGATWTGLRTPGT